MKKIREQRAFEGYTSTKLPGNRIVFSDIPDPKKALFLMLHFENKSRAILSTFFEILSHELDGRPVQRASIVVFRHDERRNQLDRTFYAVVLVPPREMGRKDMADRCFAAWHECGAGELADFVRIKSKSHLVSQMEQRLDELHEDDCTLYLAALRT